MVTSQKSIRIIEQVISIKNTYPSFRIKFNHQKIKAVGELQPTARSVSYTVEIKYKIHQQPIISVINPPLKINFNKHTIPHVYKFNKLCLYRPKYNEFTNKSLISKTIIPWISLWLYYYELWHITGEWLGGGEHPKK